MKKSKFIKTVIEQLDLDPELYRTQYIQAQAEAAADILSLDELEKFIEDMAEEVPHYSTGGF